MQEDLPKILVVVPSSLLCESNYHHWTMKMEVHLDAQCLWEVVVRTKVNRKKDHHALSVILNSESESFALQLDIKKAAKENWEIPQVLNVSFDQVV